MKKMKGFILALLLGIFVYGVNVWAGSESLVIDHVQYHFNPEFQHYSAGSDGTENVERVTVKSEINGFPVKRLDVTAFAYCDIKEVVLPDTLEIIDPMHLCTPTLGSW